MLFRSAAVQALGRRAGVPDELLRAAAAARLEDKLEAAQYATAQAPGGCTALPDEVLTAWLNARTGTCDGRPS